ncbi:MAG: tetratricopeptide repeat protein [Thermodesulfobacteriota bacterium]
MEQKNFNPSTRLFVISVLSVLVITLIVYLPALKNGFINWDDTHYITENLHIRSLDIGWLFTGVVAANWHPLTMLSHTVDFALWNMNPWGHHLTSVILHALNTALVYMVTFRLISIAQKNTDNKITGRVIAGAAAALLFGLHPLHVESVAWVSERKDVLSAFFYLIAILLYLQYAARGAAKKALYYVMSLIVFALALMSKPMAVSLPIVLLLIDFYPLDRLKHMRGIIIEKIPFFLLTILSAIVTIWAQHKGEAIQSLKLYTLTDRIVLPARAYIFYLYKMIIPLNLSPIYPRPPEAGILNLPAVISFLILASITAFCVIKSKKRFLLALWLFYLLTLLPVVGIIKVGDVAMADRYAYLPSVGPFILAGLGLALVMKKAGGRPLKAFLIITAASILVIFALMTRAQTRVWKGPITFWSEIIRVYPERVPIAYNKRGITYAKKGEFNKAAADLTMAIELVEDKAYPYFNRASVFTSLGRYEEAIKDFSAIITIDPKSTKVYYERGRLYEKTGRYEEALRDFKKVVALQPDFAEGYMDAARIYSTLGDAESATRYREKAKAVFLKKGL